MQSWGAARYGDPCRECSFDWSIGLDDAVGLVERSASAFAHATRGARGGERRPTGGWSVAQYVSHVGDNLRNWAERVQGARLGGVREVSGYDPDALAEVRRYDALPLAAALWSLGVSARMRVEALVPALAEDVVLVHEARGDQRAADVVRNNCHDARHHLWDVETILGPSEGGTTGRPGPRWGEGRLGEDVQFTVVDGATDYAPTATRAVRWLEVANAGGVLGYLWASDDGAAGWIDRAASGDDGANAGAGWYRRLRGAKARGLSAHEALDACASDPGGKAVGRVVLGSGGELPGLEALKALAGGA